MKAGRFDVLMTGAAKITLGFFLIPGEATNASSGAYSNTV